MSNVETFTLPLRITVAWHLKILYAISCVFFLVFTFVAWLSLHSLPMSLLFGLFALLSVYVFFSSFSAIEVDEKSITVIAPHGVYQMDWADVSSIETNTIEDRRFESKDDIFAFLGNKKCLVINLRFAGKEKAEFSRFIGKQIDQLQIEVKPLSSKRILQKNTRVRRFRF